MSDKRDEVTTAAKSDHVSPQILIVQDKRMAIKGILNYAGIALVLILLCVLLAKTDTLWYMFFGVIGSVWCIRNMTVNMLRYWRLLRQK